ncbi:hypothetical protein [Candidatus Pantoea floridensis]|uniref:Uncharacterized protein n=1 Tax=Candidatus Pantoea floridensis TaxID=1938870 RepID=A0A286DS28_9GAMM|nr:hypothetical protein [Pantoea floridensis]PIF06874.1 hypothetical protein BX596_5174 [Enterobacteriaceae bacterium JKS000233]SOD61458.1 hypothetical protein SAMN06273570_5144 [Pantoea floridensis]
MSFLMLGSLLSLGYALAFQFFVPGEISSLTYWCGYAMCFVLARLLASKHPQPAGDLIVIKLLALAVPAGGVFLCVWGGMNLLADPAAGGQEGADMLYSAHGRLLPLLSMIMGAVIVAVALYRIRSRAQG